MPTLCAALLAAAVCLQTPATPPAPVRDRAVTVSVVDQNGNLLVEGWRVSAVFQDPSGPNPYIPARVDVAVDDETGTARLTGLPIGLVSIGALGPDRQFADAQQVDLLGGKEVEVQLVARLVDLSDTLRVELRPTARHTVQPAPGTVVAVAQDGTRHVLERQASESLFGWRIAGLPRSVYTVRVEDPRFVAVVSDPVLPGALVRLALEGAASMVLVVHDVVRDAPVEDYEFEVRYPNVGGRPLHELARQKAVGSPGRLLDGLLADEVELTVRAPGRPFVRVRPTPLQPGERRSLTVEVGRSVDLSGRVRDSGGAAVVGARVLAFRGEHPGIEGLDPAAVTGGSFRLGHLVADTRTDDAGVFRLSGLAPDTHTFTVERGPCVIDHLTRAVLASPAPLELVVPRLGEVEIEVLFPGGEGADPRGLVLSAVPAEPVEHFLNMLRDVRGVALVGPAPRATLSLHPGARVMRLLELGEGPNPRAGPVELGQVEVEVVAGELRRATLDPRGALPVGVTLRSDVLGEDAPWLLGLGLIRADDGVPPSRNAAKLLDPVPGQPVVGTLRRGPYHFRPFAVGPGWFHESSEVVSLAGGGPKVIAVDLALAARTYELVDAAGKPLAEFPVACRFDGPGSLPGPPIVTQTDALGRIRAVGPVARLRFGLPEGQSGTVEHTSGAPLVVRIEHAR